MNANQINELNRLTQQDQERADYQAARLSRAFNMVLDMFPDIDRKRALIMAGAMVEYFDKQRH